VGHVAHMRDKFIQILIGKSEEKRPRRRPRHRRQDIRQDLREGGKL